MVKLDISYMCKKFEDSSFSYFRSMVRALKLKVHGSRDVTTPILGKDAEIVVRRLGLAMINLLTKFEVSTITCNEVMKDNAKIC